MEKGGGVSNAGLSLPRSAIFIYNFFLKGGVIKFWFIKLPNSVRIVVFTEFFLLI